MNKAINNQVIRFVGFDSAGEAFLEKDRVYRGIYPGKAELIKNVFNICHKHHLFDYGVIPTQISTYNPLPNLGYELLLEHEKIPFISYPHEWSSVMFKEAALFHIYLYEKLFPHNLVIKDWHPQNILFKGTKPVFVDFTSIIPFDNLYLEPYLTPPYIPNMFKTRWDITAAYLWEMHQRMFVPYFLLPLYLMHKGKHSIARQRMLETTLNTSRTAIKFKEVFPFFSSGQFRFRINNMKKKLALIDVGERKQRFWDATRREIENLSVVVESSNYSSYYETKGENFDHEFSTKWTKKQKVVHESIVQYKPLTVLDVASNTGWFSILAAKHGSQVVAFDIDEACVNRIYYYAKSQNLPILPLVLDFTKMTDDVYPINYPNEEKRTLIEGNFPLLLSTERRLKCDMVIALGILHHLVLGNNHDILRIVELLVKLCKKYLLLEFIAKDDNLITSELEFFPGLHKNPNDFEWYTLEFITELMKKFFKDVFVKDSNPNTRKILIGIK